MRGGRGRRTREQVGLRAWRSIVPITGFKVFGNKTNKDETSAFYPGITSYAVIYY